MRNSYFRKQLIMLTGAAAFVASGAVLAQPSGGGGSYEPQPPQQQQGQQNFSDSDLETFAEAQAEVNEVSQEFQQKAQSAEDQSQIQQLRQEANRKMVEVVQEVGLETEKYNAIAQAMRTNPDLADRIENM